jgi:hypothetical protein
MNAALPGPSVAEDELDRRWLIAVYGALLVPVYGPALLILGSSALYYVWRRKTPHRASALNRHAWRAWALGMSVYLATVVWKLFLTPG